MLSFLGLPGRWQSLQGGTISRGNLDHPDDAIVLQNTNKPRSGQFDLRIEDWGLGGVLVAKFSGDVTSCVGFVPARRQPSGFGYCETFGQPGACPI
jgi:hypothetical protein